MSGRDKVEGHVFISYVHEDKGQVDRLHAALDAAGVRVWRDTADLWPGQDWRVQIRRAFTDNALVFIACFSRKGLTRQKSYQNEELTLAIGELRQRPADQTWLIPVRLDNCEIPDRDIGGGRTLNYLHHADLFGDHTHGNLARSRHARRRRGLRLARGRLPMAAAVPSAGLVAAGPVLAVPGRLALSGFVA